MEQLNFEQKYSAVLLDIVAGINLDIHFQKLKKAIDEINEKIDTATNKASENTGMHIYKSRLIYLAFECSEKILGK